MSRCRATLARQSRTKTGSRTKFQRHSEDLNGSATRRPWKINEKTRVPRDSPSGVEKNNGNIRNHQSRLRNMALTPCRHASYHSIHVSWVGKRQIEGRRGDGNMATYRHVTHGRLRSGGHWNITCNSRQISSGAPFLGAANNPTTQYPSCFSAVVPSLSGRNINHPKTLPSISVLPSQKTPVGEQYTVDSDIPVTIQPSYPKTIELPGRTGEIPSCPSPSRCSRRHRLLLASPTATRRL